VVLFFKVATGFVNEFEVVWGDWGKVKEDWVSKTGVWIEVTGVPSGSIPPVPELSSTCSDKGRAGSKGFCGKAADFVEVQPEPFVVKVKVRQIEDPFF
jgi:hypothetical protein